MHEVKVRPRQLLIFIIIFIVILLLVHRNGQNNICKGPSFLQRVYAESDNLPKIYAITPTYTRPSQKAELTRLSHIFMLMPNLHWILVEDENTTTTLVKNLIARAGLQERATQLNIKTPAEYKLKSKDPNWIKPRGVQQRNLALSWLRQQLNPSEHSIVYFMDDDNSYSVELFVEMSKIERERVGVWPVGLVGGLLVEKPLLNADQSKVVGFNAAWRPERPFPIDMAGFAISSDLLLKHPKAQFSFEVKRGYQESEILRQITTLAELQPLANSCLDVLVWHTRTEAVKLSAEDALIKQGKHSNQGMEV